jgi:hypothetical protein
LTKRGGYVHALTLIRPDVQDTVIEKMDKDIRSMGFSYNRLTTGKHHQMGVLGPAIFSHSADERSSKRVAPEDFEAGKEDDIETLCGVKSHEDRHGWKFWTQ